MKRRMAIAAHQHEPRIGNHPIGQSGQSLEPVGIIIARMVHFKIFAAPAHSAQIVKSLLHPGPGCLPLGTSQKIGILLFSPFAPLLDELPTIVFILHCSSSCKFTSIYAGHRKNKCSKSALRLKDTAVTRTAAADGTGNPIGATSKIRMLKTIIKHERLYHFINCGPSPPGGSLQHQ